VAVIPSARFVAKVIEVVAVRLVIFCIAVPYCVPKVALKGCVIEGCAIFNVFTIPRRAA
jgi:hypothetical protein